MRLSVVGTTGMEPVLRAIADDVGTDAAGLPSATESRRGDENATDFSLTAAMRDRFFTFLGSRRSLRATFPEKTP